MAVHILYISSAKLYYSEAISYTMGKECVPNVSQTRPKGSRWISQKIRCPKDGPIIMSQTYPKNTSFPNPSQPYPKKMSQNLMSQKHPKHPSQTRSQNLVFPNMSQKLRPKVGEISIVCSTRSQTVIKFPSVFIVYLDR